MFCRVSGPARGSGVSVVLEGHPLNINPLVVVSCIPDIRFVYMNY